MPQISEKTLEEETVDTEHDESADIETQKLFDERDPRVVPKKLKEKIKIEN